MNIIDNLSLAGVFLSFFILILSLLNLRDGIKRKKKLVAKNTIPRKQIQHNSLSPKIANEAIFRLSSFSHKVKPDCIVGINRGGTMVGAFLALGLGISSKHFTRCLISKKEGYKVTYDKEHVQGVVIVIDDICRSGQTMEHAIRELEKNTKVKRIYSAVLIASLNEDRELTYKKLDFCSFATRERNLKLPWSIGPVRDVSQKQSEVDVFSELGESPLDDEALSKIATEVSTDLFNR